MRIVVGINLFLCVLFVLPAQAEVFTGGAGTTNWLDDANWGDNTSPGNNATISTLSIQAEVDYTATQGTTTETDDFHVGEKAGAGTLNLLGGTIQVNNNTWGAIIGQQGTGTLNIDGGNLIQQNDKPFRIGNTSTGNGTVNLISGLFQVATVNEDFSIGREGATGLLDISGGTATFASAPTFGSGNGSINFTTTNAGSLTITGANKAYYESIYATGKLTYDGSYANPFDDVFFVTGETITADLPDRHAVISPSALTIVEGDSDSYSISLVGETGMAPTADVQVTATPTTNGSDVSLNGQPAGQPVTLTFTAALGYATPQTITVSAVDDALENGNRDVIIQHTVSSAADANWNVVTTGDETVAIYDNEGLMGEYDLWYNQPATNWETQALPIGNGRLGGMVFGGVGQELIQFNEDSMWSGDDTSEGTGTYQALGDLYVNMTGHTGETNYRRKLDISEAIHTITYDVGGTTYTREYFAGYSAQAMVMRYTADQAGAYTGSIVLTDARANTSVAAGNKITFTGTLSNSRIYETQLMVLNEGGSIAVSGSDISFTNCDSLTLLLVADTDYLADSAAGWTGSHPAAALNAQLAAAAAKSYAALRSEHITEYKEMFDRCVLDIGGSAIDWGFTPTDVRLSNYKSGAVDPSFENLVFQYGRYLLISSSRPGNGALPANLQGLWCNSLTPPWRSDYHSNINIQMNYWLAEPTNLAECHQTLMDYFSSLRDVRKLRTQDKYGAGTRGWTVQTENNIYGGSSWKWNPPGSAWYCQHMWEHYSYGMDQTYLLNQAYPMLKEVCEFWVDRLVLNTASGKLVSPDSWSPEQGPAGTAETDIALYDEEIVWDLFTNYIEASEILGLDSVFRAEVSAKRDQLLTPMVGSWGQVMEWYPEISLDNSTNTHRHVSHLFALHPGRQISPFIDSALADAARVTLNARGDGGTGWSKAWKINFWARLHDGDRVHTLLGEHLKNNFYDNLYDAHPPFQIDGNFGYTAGVAEMLLQSHNGVVHLLPALPSSWPDGDVTGLCTRGGLEVDMKWADGQLTLATIRPKKDGVYNLRYGTVEVVLDATAGEVYYWNGQWKNDLNLNGKIDLTDFSMMAQEWLSADCGESNNWCLGKDVNRDNKVDAEDLVSICQGWLNELVLE